MKIKTSELIGLKLDLAVAKAARLYEAYVERRNISGDPIMIKSLEELVMLVGYSPSTDWVDGGPIMEREKIEPSWHADVGLWGCSIFPKFKYQYGPTMLIAAMRGYVESKFGEEVEL